MDNKATRRRLKISINLGITSALTLLILLTTTTLCLVILWNLREILRDDLQKQLDNTLRVAALLVDGRHLPELTDPSQETGETYLVTKHSLQAIQKQIPEVHFIYTMRRNDDGDAIFVVDAETDPAAMSHIGDVYADMTPVMRQALQATAPGQTFIEREPSPDQWGTWLSGFITLGDGQGGSAGLLGMDISAGTIASYELRAVSIMVSISVAVSLVVLVLGLFLSRRITTPLKALESDMDRITQFKIDDNTVVSSVFTEIRRMSDAVNDMKGSLRAC